MSVRVRIAPAPSGSLHVGNVRTALFNWLFARHEQGVFVLRIEDTDAERVSEDHYSSIQEDLRWIGLDWDEGPGAGGPHEPYLQSKRLEFHKEAVKAILDAGAAYRCYCTKAELDRRRKQAMAQKRPPIYDRRCRSLSTKQRSDFENEGRSFTIRFAVPEGSTSFEDLVTGAATWEHEHMGDFVIVRSDGMPLYDLAATVDDGAMRITHVIRGLDLQSSTPRQILIHQALGNPVPRFGHVPLINGPGGKPLGKRHGPTSLAWFRDGGYLPEAMLNYLALLGWGTADDTILNKDDLIEKFEISHVHASPARFDQKKLNWMNGEYIRALTPSDLQDRFRPFLASAGLIDEPVTDGQNERLKRCVPPLQSRMKTLAEGVEWARPLFDDVEPDIAEVEKTKGDFVPGLLAGVIASLDSQAELTVDSVEPLLRAAVEATGHKPAKAFKPLYVAILGRSAGAPLFDSIAILGKEESLRRLRRAQVLFS